MLRGTSSRRPVWYASAMHDHPTAHPDPDVLGVILAGGQSRRMGGGDKALRDLGGRPMLTHVIARLSPQVSRIVINANGDPARFTPFGLTVFPDTRDGFLGPLAGVLAGLLWCAAHAPQCRYIATAASDAPFLPHNLVARLKAAVASRTGIALAASGGALHPVIGLWPVALADDLDAALAAGVRKVLAWTDRHGTIPVEFAAERLAAGEVDPFFNANHPEELETARRLFGDARHD